MQNAEPLSSEQAATLLQDAEVVPCMQLPLADAKATLDKLLAKGVPVALGRDDHCTKGCAPKVLLLARPDDIRVIATLFQEEWLGMLQGEGNIDEKAMQSFMGNFVAPVAGAGAGPQGDLPCPACGHAAPLQDGACADCGLVLE